MYAGGFELGISKGVRRGLFMEQGGQRRIERICKKARTFSDSRNEGLGPGIESMHSMGSQFSSGGTLKSVVFHRNSFIVVPLELR